MLEEINKNILTGDSRIWIFQTNPKRYKIVEVLSDNNITEEVWETNQHEKEIKHGDYAFIWMCGKEAGIYALTKIISDPILMKDSKQAAKYWIHEFDKNNTKPRVKIEFILKFTNNPIFRKEIKEIPELNEMSIMKFASGTNFKVTLEEWKLLYHAIKSRQTS